MIDVNLLPSVPLPEWRTLPKEPGIYLVLADNGDVMYVGKAQDLSTRWKSHHRTPDLKNAEYRGVWLAAAATTKTSAQSTQAEIERLLRKHGVEHFGYMT